jgi:hypothetical protein
MDGTVLPITDVFWTINYPPQGFGCKCRAVAATEEEFEAGGGKRPEGWQDAPDAGWGYNVGQASTLRHEDLLGQKLASLDPAIARVLLEQLMILAPDNDRRFSAWVDDVHSHTTADGVIKTTGAQRALWFVEPDIEDGMRAVGGPELTTSLITVSDRQLLHAQHLADSADRGGRQPERIVTLEDVRAMPRHIREPRAVLWDRHNKGLVYVFDVVSPDKPGKWAVRLNMLHKQNRMVSNEVRSGAYVDRMNLTGGQYEVLRGEL